MPGWAHARTASKALLQSCVLPSAWPPTSTPLLQLPNGKADLKSLPEPDWNAIAAARIYTAPADELESALARIWKDALGAAGEQGIG